MKPKILLTGFGAFPGVAVNPTGLLMERIAADSGFFPGAELKPLVLQTAFAAARAEFERSAAEFGPDAILSFGVAVGECEYRIERLAANLDDCRSPDIEGELRSARRIETEGPENYPNALPVTTIEAALRAANIPVRFSDSAGNYVCNHIFYSACHWTARNAHACRAGFIHVPDPASSADWTNEAYMTTLESVAKIALNAIVSDLIAASVQIGPRNTK